MWGHMMTSRRQCTFLSYNFEVCLFIESWYRHGVCSRMSVWLCASYDMKLDLLHFAPLTSGQFLTLNFRGHIMHRSIRLDERNTRRCHSQSYRRKNSKFAKFARPNAAWIAVRILLWAQGDWIENEIQLSTPRSPGGEMRAVWVLHRSLLASRGRRVLIGPVSPRRAWKHWIAGSCLGLRGCESVTGGENMKGALK